MLQFNSASARIVNSARAMAECLEVATDNQPGGADLIIFNASIGHDFDTLLQEAHKLAPNAQILGASCCGVVGKEGVSESMKDIAVMTVKGDEFAVASVNNLYGSNAYEKTIELAEELKRKAPGATMVNFMGSGIDTNNSECLRAFKEVLGEEVTIFGATSSDNMKGYVSYQVAADEVRQHSAWAVAFNDPTLKIATGATHGFLAVGEPLKVTRSEGHIIKELNGKPAWSEYTRHLGLSPDVDCSATIPIGALGEALPESVAGEYGNPHILRAVTKADGEDMYYATDCPEGTPLWLTKRDEELIFSDMDRLTRKLYDKLGNGTPVAVFHADCLARGRSLFGRIIKEELVGKMQHPFHNNAECPPWLGMYGFGEFARLGGKNTYHNYTTALYVIYRQPQA